MSIYLTKVRQNLRTLSLKEVISDVLDTNESNIVAKINEQLHEGRRGNALMPKYRPNTILKKKPNHIYNPEKRIQLYDTGSFRGSIFATNNGEFVEIDAKHYLRDELVGRYTDEIFELSDLMLEELVEEIFNDVVMNAFNKITG